jgi:NTP pyrophosphatase (non-canonical NTP hydrolase)
MMPNPLPRTPLCATTRAVADPDITLAALKERVVAFCEARDWDQFHGPKDLAIGIVTEASELLDLFRFQSDDQIAALRADPAKRARVEEELADVLFFVVRFAERWGIDLATAFDAKMARNATKYPVEKSRGSNRKYDEL